MSPKKEEEPPVFRMCYGRQKEETNKTTFAPFHLAYKGGVGFSPNRLSPARDNKSFGAELSPHIKSGRRRRRLMKRNSREESTLGIFNYSETNKSNKRNCCFVTHR